jgi:hypothetical protein
LIIHPAPSWASPAGRLRKTVEDFDFFSIFIEKLQAAFIVSLLS